MKLFVDLYMVDFVYEQYSAMKGLIEEWGNTHGLLQTGAGENTSGETTSTFEEIPEGMNDKDFLSLYNKVKDMADDLEQAGLDIKALLNRVEEFYSILYGLMPDLDADYLSKGEPSERIAALDSSKVSNMILESATVKNNTVDENTAIDICCEQLSGLKKVSVPYATDKSTIKSCIRKQGYIDTLLSAFLKYCTEVDIFNSDTQKRLDLISEDEYAPVTERAYNLEDAVLAGCSEPIVLNIAQEVLDKAGVTEDEKKNALDNGMSLFQLASDVAIVQKEDAIRGNDKGITLFKMVLDGNYSEAFKRDGIASELAEDDNSVAIWYAIADYQLSSVDMSDPQNIDGSTFLEMLNDEFNCSNKVVDKVYLAAGGVTTTSSYNAILSLGTDEYSQKYSDYNKNLTLFNLIGYADSEVDSYISDFNMSQRGDSVQFTEETLTITLSNLNLTVNDNNCLVVNVDNNIVFTDPLFKNQATLSKTGDSHITVQCSPSTSVNNSWKTTGDNSQAIVDAIQAKNKAITNTMENVMVLGVDAAGLYFGVPYAGSVLKLGFSAAEHNGWGMAINANEAVEGAWGDKNIFGHSIQNGCTITADGIDIAISINDIIEAQNNIINTENQANIDSYYKWFGSGTLCNVTYNDGTSRQFHSYNVGIAEPSKVPVYVACTTKDAGLAVVVRDNKSRYTSGSDYDKIMRGTYDYKASQSYYDFDVAMSQHISPESLYKWDSYSEWE